MTQFPTATGTDLDGRTYRLPDDFEGALNLVFVAFEQTQQVQVGTWVSLAERLAADYDRLRYYALPIIDERYTGFRRFIDAGMRTTIGTAADRRRIIPLYVDSARFRERLDVPSARAIQVLLVDDGEVVWLAEGPHTPSTAADLEAVVASRLGEE